MQVETGTGDALIDARLLADLLHLDPTAVHLPLGTQEIASLCECARLASTRANLD